MNAPIRAPFSAEGIVRKRWPELYANHVKVEPIGPRTYVVTDRQGNTHRAWVGRDGESYRHEAEPEDLNIRDGVLWLEQSETLPIPYAEHTRDVEVLLDDGAWASVRVTFSVRLVDAVEAEEVWALHWRLEDAPEAEAEELPPELALEQHDHWIASRILMSTPNQHDWR